MPESRSAKRERIDWLGAATGALSLGALTYAVTRWPETGGLAPDVLSASAVGIAAALAFLVVERRVQSPLLPPEMFRSRDFSGLNAMTLLLYAALTGALFLVPYNLIQLQGYTATEAGLAVMPLGVVIGLLSRRAGRVADRFGPRPQLVIGPLLVAAGCAGLALPGIGGGYFTTFFGPVMLIALGMAAAVSPLTTAVMNAATDDRSGAASGINNTASRVAGVLAVAVTGALATAVFTGGLEAQLAPMQLDEALERRLLEDAARLAELQVPAAVPTYLRTGLENAIDHAFVEAFRAGVLLNAGLAALAAGIATQLMRRG